MHINSDKYFYPSAINTVKRGFVDLKKSSTKLFARNGFGRRIAMFPREMWSKAIKAINRAATALFRRLRRCYHRLISKSKDKNVERFPWGASFLDKKVISARLSKLNKNHFIQALKHFSKEHFRLIPLSHLNYVPEEILVGKFRNIFPLGALEATEERLGCLSSSKFQMVVGTICTDDAYLPVVPEKHIPFLKYSHLCKEQLGLLFPVEDENIERSRAKFAKLSATQVCKIFPKLEEVQLKLISQEQRNSSETLEMLYRSRQNKPYSSVPKFRSHSFSYESSFFSGFSNFPNFGFAFGASSGSERREPFFASSSSFKNAAQNQHLANCNTLGLSMDSSKDEIKKAYKKKALIYHPDRVKQGPQESSGDYDNRKRVFEEKFKEIADAYNSLMHD